MNQIDKSQLNARLMVGMEIHVELATQTKMWTAAGNYAHPAHDDAEPNSLVDSVVLGLPGTLPVANKAAIEASIMVGLALNCQIARYTKWDRKSYYYPDLPKNYQISQFDQPICFGGQLSVSTDADDPAKKRNVRITRAHLEEDAGKLLHEAPGGRKIDHSIVDLNRAGTPLLEIVTEPDIVTADHAVNFAMALRQVVRHLGVSRAILQQGQMRFEPNINVVIEHAGQTYATPIVEIKNLNSFRALRGAIEYEYHRQIDAWIEDRAVMGARAKTTRGWDDVNQVTVLQRHKEDSDEYRYFPDPDLVPLTITDHWLDQIRAALPAGPAERQMRYERDYGLPPKQVQLLLDEPGVCALFDDAIDCGGQPGSTASLIVNNLARIANAASVAINDLAITAQQLAAIDELRQQGKISSNATDELLEACANDASIDPAITAEQRGLIQVSDDSALDRWVDAAIKAEPQAAEDVRQGNDKAISRLVGAAMKLSKGQANPQRVQENIRAKLS